MGSIYKLYSNITVGLFCAALTTSVAAATSAALVASALAHPDRPAADAADDARRMPLEVLAFAGLEEGMAILELEAGGGYYTEILSRAVGPDGSVVMQLPPGLDAFAGDAPAVRTANNRLPNVRIDHTDFDALNVADNSIDMVTWILGPHELGFEPEGGSLGDPAQTFREIARVLKPGGTLLAIDHIAPDGAGLAAGGTLHRIEESVVTTMAAQVGLSVLRSSNMLKNPQDQLDVGVFNPAVRGKTSQFVVLYQK